MADDSERNFSALDTEDIAMLLGVSSRMIRNYVRDKDLPSKEDGRGRRFNWPDVLEWYVRYRAEMSGSDGSEAEESGGEGDEWQTETMEQAELRKTIAEADLKELELARGRGQVVAIQDVQRTMANLAKAIQTKILAWPSKLAMKMAGKPREQIRAILDHDARQICHELATIQAKPIEPGQDSEGQEDGNDA